MKTRYGLFAGLLIISAALNAAEPMEPIAATTASGDAVKLHPNGRWEYVDVIKAEQAAVVASQFPENQVCHPAHRVNSLVFAAASRQVIKTSIVAL
jgi:hypothetical protein